MDSNPPPSPKKLKPPPGETPVVPSTISRDILDINDPPAEHNLPALREFITRASARRTSLDAKILALKAELDDLVKKGDTSGAEVGNQATPAFPPLRAVDVEPSPLKTELDELLNGRRDLDIQIGKHLGALSPLRRIPTELLSLIFEFAIDPGERPGAPLGEILMNMVPWELSNVCARWRRIALSQPNLWTFIGLTSHTRPPSSSTLRILEAQLARSQRMPLRIHFCPFREDRLTAAERKVFRLLSRHCDRWQDVNLTGPVSMYHGLEDRGSQFPLLRKLEIVIGKEEEYATEVEIGGDLFAHCPKLEEVSMNLGDWAYSIDACLDTSNLRRYFAYNSLQDHANILSSANNVVDCVMMLPWPLAWDMDHWHSGAKIQLPNLCRLAIDDAKLLDVLDVPALQELYCSHNSPELHAHLQNMHGLRKLYVGKPRSRVIIDFSSFLNAAQAIPCLCAYIPLACASMLFEFLGSATTLQASTHGVPSSMTSRSLVLFLGPLDLHDKFGLPIDEEQLLCAIESQWHHRQLHAFQMYAAKFIPTSNTLARLEALRSQGMDVQLERDSERLYAAKVVPSDFDTQDCHSPCYLCEEKPWIDLS
ncbi:hypothetical protein R3P38DRAFT_3014489 [Favolaschia claudopus]|uniref:F-box domain-containing protein n=1 Tax=Favolaschia claudopus TaxID=2862362 RepID=A0AAW0AIB8_9AGAR